MSQTTISEGQLYISAASAAVRYDVSEQLIRRVIASGNVEVIRIGTKTIRINISSLERAFTKLND
ncbi:hypothetical protein [Rhodococcus sp. AQ5-07]|uniref:hypothetical protein n=1 Tax=Rhodococcus sp. AQ5-07 TaxID=2054902 RepID=UPI000DBF9493|nr:hypothetical protein [Rhodococcus sp. AQ5-07]RAL31167.1 hypothetical protein CVN56_29810 [Rhodococcus sp. AQ5-07]